MSDDGRGGEAREAHLRGRVRDAYLPWAALRLRTQKPAAVSAGAAKPGGTNTTLLSSMSLEGMGPTLTVEGSTTSVVFETYVEQVLAPTLRRGQVVVMDNLSAHKPKRIRELIEQRGCELVYLPSYSPDYNPIEEAFAKIKNLLRKASARSKEALIEAIAAALSAISAEDIRGYFQHAGYRLAGQLL